MNGIELIAAERQRQIYVEGWTPEHDDEHRYGELSMAARAYVSVGSELTRNADAVELRWKDRPYSGFPWPEWWKPSPDPIRNLVKAGALVAAEIDRLQRVAGTEVKAPVPVQPSEVDQLAQQIADSCAKSDIECFCLWVEQDGTHSGRWYNIQECDPDDREEVLRALRYLALRQILILHPEDSKLVRFQEMA